MTNTEKPRLAILSNEDPYDHLSWVKACEEYPDVAEYRVINLTEERWLEEVQEYSPDALLLKPSGLSSLYRTLYQERLDILVNDLFYFAFPSFNEVRIYENKRFFSYWAKANSIPHPETRIFYTRREALKYIDKVTFPVVGKLNVGASGNGVQILKSRKEAFDYVAQAFKTGLIARVGPKLSKGKIIERIADKIKDPGSIVNRLRTYARVASDRQIGFVLLQDFVRHAFEWRVVRIGDSFFAHKKIIRGDKASGSLIKQYDHPPTELLNFVREITDKHHFFSQAVDIFESERGYLVNEMQCIFGQSDPYQMLINGLPGRYIRKGNEWVFEEGDFARNESYNMRVEYVLNKLQGMEQPLNDI